MEELFRYPVKSMSGERLEAAELGWYGLEGDRRLAFRRVEIRSGMPWLTASKLPELILFSPQWRGTDGEGGLPTHIRTPEGEEMAVFSQELAEEVGRRHRSPVEMMHLRHGIFDEANVSVIATSTVREIGRLAEQKPDVRRFRPNIVVDSIRSVPFEEDEWLGGVLSFGEGPEAAAINVTLLDERCSMVNLDPDSARSAPEMLKTIVRVRQNLAGVYGAVTRCGRLAVGQTIFFEPRGEPRGGHGGGGSLRRRLGQGVSGRPLPRRDELAMRAERAPRGERFAAGRGIVGGIPGPDAGRFGGGPEMYRRAQPVQSAGHALGSV